MELKFILESLLFSAQKPMSVKELRDLLANAATAEDADEVAKPFKKIKDDDLTAALEELVVALHVLYGYDKQYDLSKLPELGEIASRVSGLPIAANKPILGSRNFTRESGIGVDLVVREPLAMVGTHPALTGRAGEVVLGKKSGKASITYTLEKLGIPEPDDAAIGEMLAMVKDLGIKKRGLVTDDEFRGIAKNVVGSKAQAAE